MDAARNKKERKARLLLSQSKYSTQYNYVLTIQHRYLAAAEVALSRQQFYTAWSVKSVQKYLPIQNLQIICRMLLLLYAILLLGSFDNKDIFFNKKNFFKIAQNTFCFGNAETIQWLCFSLPLFSLICTLLNVHAVHRSQIATFIICLESKKNCYLYFYSQLHCCKTYTVYLFIDQYIL